MKKRKMTAKQLKYFGKGHKTVKAVRKRSMTKYKKYKSYARKGFGGMRSFLPPILAGVSDSIVDPISPVDGVGSVAVGFVMHNEMIKNLGLYKIGYSLGNILPIPKLGGSSTSAGGFN